MVLMRELLLIQLYGQRFAVDRQTVRDVQQVNVHRLPLTPEWLAGIAVVDDRTVTLADLCACISCGKGVNGSGQALMLASPGKIHGFVVSGSAVPCDAADDAFLPVPGDLATDAISSCVVLENEPVPVLDLTRICRRLVQASVGEAVDRSLRPVGTDGIDTGAVRLFSVGELMFGIAASQVDGPAVRADRITPLPESPPFVRGVVVHDRSLVPVIDLCSALDCEEGYLPELMLPVNCGKDRFGLFIDQDNGTIHPDNVILRRIPKLALRPGILLAVLQQEQVIPILDLSGLLSARSESAPEFPFDADSVFPSLFLTKDVEVTEFSLLGMRQALPKCEVETVLPFRPFRRIPNTIAIVRGVVAHEKELLPVLDLGLIFGRLSLPTPEWSMLLMKNGDFRAFILVERVYGDVHLAQEVHRELPIVLPYPVVYGCYPMHTGVRLVLNVLELVRHFEKAEVQDLLPSFVPESEQRSIQIEPQVAPLRTTAEVTSRSGDGKMPALSGSGADVQERAEQVEEVQPIEDKQLKGAEESAETPAQAETNPVPAGESPSSGTKSGAPTAEQGGFEQPGVDERSEPQALIETASAAADQTPEKASEASTGEPKEPGHAESVRAAVLSTIVESNEGPDPARPGGEQAELIRPFDVKPVSTASREQEQSLRSFIYGAIALVVLVALFALFGRFENLDPAGPRPAPIKQKTVEAVKPTPAATRPTLELEIPRSMPVSMDTYIVKEADTLWSISERFTGNPYNYPKIAGENRIADPDLIFPGQKIKLIRK